MKVEDLSNAPTRLGDEVVKYMAANPDTPEANILAAAATGNLPESATTGILLYAIANALRERCGFSEEALEGHRRCMSAAWFSGEVKS